MIDAHVHIVTRSILGEALRDWGVDEERIASHIEPVPDVSTRELRRVWLEAMDANGIEKVVFMAFKPGNDEFINFVKSSERFAGFTSLDPTRPSALDALKGDLDRGMSGLKLYPPGRGFSVADERAYPIYEYCEKNRIPILIHFGITIGPACDLRFGNPIDLSPVISRFSNIPFILAHFGAGFFREALMITYKRNNVYFDTSGTNDWLRYHPHGLSLVDVFKQTLGIVGPERVIFGSDSRLIPDEYRVEMLSQQRSILELLTDPESIDLVMGENARRIYHL